MSKHTPGPWVVLREPRGMWITRADKSFAIASIPPMAENAASDARLIAAAPQLLEALELARDYMHAHVMGLHEAYRGYPQRHARDDADLAKIDAAISAAKGEA